MYFKIRKIKKTKKKLKRWKKLIYTFFFIEWAKDPKDKNFIDYRHILPEKIVELGSDSLMAR